MPPESSKLYHLRGHFLPPQGGTVPNSWGGTVSKSRFALCFPIFGTIWPFFWKNNWTCGNIGGTAPGFRKCACYVLDFFCLIFLCCLFFLVFSSYALLCYVSIVLTNKKARPKDKESKKQRKENNKETNKRKRSKERNKERNKERKQDNKEDRNYKKERKRERKRQGRKKGERKEKENKRRQKQRKRQ